MPHVASRKRLMSFIKRRKRRGEGDGDDDNNMSAAAASTAQGQPQGGDTFTNMPLSFSDLDGGLRMKAAENTQNASL